MNSKNEFLKGISPNFRNEIIFNLDRYTDSSLQLGLTTGLMAKALQNGYIAKYEKPIVIQGLLISINNKIILGLRNKPKFREKLSDEKNDFKLMLCPAGYATFNKEGSLIRSFYKELKEEIGLYEKDIDNIKIFGHNHDVNFTEGIRITYIVFVNLSFNEIKKRWLKADHNWEYLGLIGLDTKKEGMRTFMKAKDFSCYHKRAKGIIDSSIKPVFNSLILDNNCGFEILRKI